MRNVHTAPMEVFAQIPNGPYELEPYEAGWAAEALAMVYVREAHGDAALWVAVTHGDLVKAVLADATGAGLARFQRYTADPASVSVVRYGGRHTFLLGANDLAPELSRYRPDEPPPADAVVGGGSG